MGFSSFRRCWAASEKPSAAPGQAEASHRGVLPPLWCSLAWEGTEVAGYSLPRPLRSMVGKEILSTVTLCKEQRALCNVPHETFPRQMWPWAEEQGTLRVLNTWQQIPKPKRRLKCKSGTQGFSQKHIKTRHMPACSFIQSALEFMFPGLSPQGQLLQPCTPSSPEMRGN